MASTLLISGAAKFGTSKPGKKIIGLILGIFCMILFIIISIISGLISIFSSSGKISNDFDAKTTGIYNDLRSIYDVYALDQQEKIQNLAIEYRDANMDYELIEIYNPETQKYEIAEQWYCKAEISHTFQYINSAYTLAYLSIKNQRDYLSDKSKVRINEKEVTKFWDIIAGIKVEEGGTKDEPTYFIHNTVMTPEQIADEFFSSDILKKQYLQSVYIISQFVGVETFIEDMHTSENKLNIPLYYQYDASWGNKIYGNGNIAKNGCAPTCIAMIFTHLKGYKITPSDIVDFTGNNYYVPGAGSSWQIFSACADKWDVNCTYIGVSKNLIISELESGHPVILSMGPGIFTSTGHFIVLTGITENGKVTVNDPNDNSKKNHAGKEFSLSQILGQAKGGWKFD